MSDVPAGSLHVSNNVIADLVGEAALECYGVVGMTAPSAVDGLNYILPKSRMRRGVAVNTRETGVHVDLYVIIEYGTSLNAVCQNLIDRVSFVLNTVACVPLEGVDVHVKGIKTRK